VFLLHLIYSLMRLSYFFFFNDTATTEIYPLSLHDALPIWRFARRKADRWRATDEWRTEQDDSLHAQRPAGGGRRGCVRDGGRSSSARVRPVWRARELRARTVRVLHGDRGRDGRVGLSVSGGAPR